jgi:hypothetical protein
VGDCGKEKCCGSEEGGSDRVHGSVRAARYKCV